MFDGASHRAAFTVSIVRHRYSVHRVIWQGVSGPGTGTVFIVSFGRGFRGLGVPVHRVIWGFRGQAQVQCSSCHLAGGFGAWGSPFTVSFACHLRVTRGPKQSISIVNDALGGPFSVSFACHLGSLPGPRATMKPLWWGFHRVMWCLII